MLFQDENDWLEGCWGKKLANRMGRSGWKVLDSRLRGNDGYVVERARGCGPGNDGYWWRGLGNAVRE